MLIFISGGVRSGKSTYAEEIALQYAEEEGKQLFYLATSPTNDGVEMNNRIKIHQEVRGEEWQTIEEIFHIDKVVSLLPSHSIILLDCMTVWLSTAMFMEKQTLIEIIEKFTQVFLEVKRNKHTLIIVSNDVNEEVPSQDKLVQKYVYYLEQLHKEVIANSEQAIQVIAGVPYFWKGKQKI